MSTDVTIPVKVSAEAAVHIAELGVQEAFETMVRHAKENFPGLSSVEVTLDFAPWMSAEPAILFRFHYPCPGSAADPHYRDWVIWLVQTFPPDIGRHFATLRSYEPANGR